MKLLTKTRIAEIRNRAENEMSQYHLIGDNGRYQVRHYLNENRSYAVNLHARDCECKAFKREGYCKHTAMCQMQDAADRALESLAAQYRDMESGRYEMENARSERAEATGSRIYRGSINSPSDMDAAHDLPNLTPEERDALTWEYDRAYKHYV
jgi:hypothetical protein